MVQAFVEALRELFTAGSGRLLHIIVPAHAYTQTLGLLRALGEASPEPCPLWVLAAPFLGAAPGWDARARAIAGEEASEAHPGSPPEPELAADAAGAGSDPFEGFVRILAEALAGSHAPTGGVVVLAPQHVADVAAYSRDIDALVREPRLSLARWAILDPVHSSVGDLVERLGAAARRVVLPSVDRAARNALEGVITELTTRASRFPPFFDERIATDSALRAEGAAPLRRLLAEAERAFELGRFAHAAALQANVERVLRANALHEEAVHVALRHARSIVATGDAEQGQQVFVTALREAEQRGMDALVPDAYASLGSMHMKCRRFLAAYKAYARAGQLAARRGSRESAADMLRCAGHAALNAEMPDRATEVWTHAFDLLGASAPVAAGFDMPRRIVVLGIALADAFEARGNLAAAQALQGHAEAIERRTPRDPGSWS